MLKWSLFYVGLVIGVLIGIYIGIVVERLT